MSTSGVVKPGTSALVESVRKRSTPSSPSRANARRSVIRLSSGSWSILKSPVCRTSPAPVRMATASASGIEWLTATNSSSKGPERQPVALGHPVVHGLEQPVLPQLGVEQRQGELGADQRDVAALAEEVRRRADVVLVPVGEHQRLDLVQAVPDRLEVREDQVDTRVVVLGEEHPAVDDQQPAVVLEDGHVPADLTETAERDDPQAALDQVARRGQLGMGMTHVVTPDRFRGGRPRPGPRAAPRPPRRPGARAALGRCGCLEHRAAGGRPWRWWRRSWRHP